MIDTHAHLNFPQLKSDLDNVISNAKQNGIDTFVNIGAGLASTKESLELANNHPEIYATVGIHPCSAEEWNKDVENFFDNEIANNPKVIGVGECGIDYYRCNAEDAHPDSPDSTNREIQHQAFRDQIRLAKKHQKPFVVHSRNAKETTWKNKGSAANEIWQIINEENYFNCVFHCFAEDLEFAKQLWEREVYVSFNGTITYPKNENLREVAKHCPSNLYILETDCPFLPPQSKRGKRCEPAYIQEFAETISQLRNESFNQIAEQTTKNAKAFYKSLPQNS